MILIADDFESEIVLLKTILIELGFKDIVVAYDGLQAINALESTNEFKAVITDYNMPFKNGGEVVDRALELGVKKIVLRSSHSVPTLILKLKELEIDPNCIEIICKRDFDSSTLKNKLKEFLI